MSAMGRKQTLASAPRCERGETNGNCLYGRLDAKNLARLALPVLSKAAARRVSPQLERATDGLAHLSEL